MSESLTRNRRRRPPAPAKGKGRLAAVPRALPAAPAGGFAKAAMLLLWLLVLLPPLYIAPAAQEPFRLPKLMLAEWLAVASLLPLAWQVRAVAQLRWSDLWRQPAVRAALPLVLVATAGLALASHPEHVRQGLADLWIGAACLAGWSAGLSAERLRRLLGALLWPGVALALFGILQFHGVQPLQFAGIRAGSRMAVTSTAGNPGDLAAFLVLPCLAAQWLLARGGPAGGAAPGRPARSGGWRAGRRGWLVAALAVCAYGMALTETFAALAALLLGSLVFWALVLRGTAGARRFAAVAAALVLLTLAVTAAVPGLRLRALIKLQGIRHGDFDVILTGRMDGWRTAFWMLRQHPLAGVGQGAYRTEFAPAKLALIERGTAFSTTQQQNFVNAHNEVLEVAADCGLPGLAALAWGVWVVAGAVRRRAAGGTEADAADLDESGGAPWRRDDAAFAVAAAVAVAALCLVDFPFRIALVAFPALLFLSWVLRPARSPLAADLGGAAGTGGMSGAGGVRGSLVVWPLLALLAAGLAMQSQRWRDRLLAGTLVRQVQMVSLSVAGTNPGALERLMPYNLAALRRAAEADPSAVEVPLSRGSLYLLLQRSQEAADEYRRAVALEPHPEIYLHLGDALLASGRFDDARRNYRIAVLLDPWLRTSVPGGAL